MTITNGTVEFERNTRPADFESKRSKATLFFVVDPGEDYESISAAAMQHAQSVVSAALGLSAPPLAGGGEASLHPANAGAGARGTRKPPYVPNEAVAVKEPEGWAAKPAEIVADAPVHPALPAFLSDDGLRKVIENKIGAAAGDAKEGLTVKIRELIATINGDPKRTVYMLDQAQRAQFVTTLTGL